MVDKRILEIICRNSHVFDSKTSFPHDSHSGPVSRTTGKKKMEEH